MAAFMAAVVEKVAVMFIIAAVAGGGICLGKKLRDKSDAKKAAEEAAEQHTKED